MLYGWVRDTSFALDVLMRRGLQHDAHSTLSWMLRAISGTAPEIRPFYGLRGSGPEEWGELGVRGYRDSRAARDGNKAVSQAQWGNFGDMLVSVWLAAEPSLAMLDPGTARMLENPDAPNRARHLADALARLNPPVADCADACDHLLFLLGEQDHPGPAKDVANALTRLFPSPQDQERIRKSLLHLLGSATNPPLAGILANSAAWLTETDDEKHRPARQ